MLSSIATAVGFAVVSTHAFLVPSTFSTPDAEAIDSLPFEHAHEVEERITDLQCPGCPVQAVDLLGNPHGLRMENQLRLNFSVSNDEAGGQVLLNGLPIYPMDLVQTLKEPLTAPQIVNIGGKASIAGNPTLGWQVSINHPLRDEPGNDALNLLELQLEIFEVGDRFVKGIESVELKLLETSSKKLMLGDLTVLPPAAPTSHAECTTALCQWRAIAAEKLSEVKGCVNKLRPGHRARPKHRIHGRPRPHGARPHGGRRPHHHQHHRKHSEFIDFAANLVLHIFIPIAVGVMAGITASIVGMAAGQFAIYLWRVLFRRGSHSCTYSTIDQEETMAKDQDEEARDFHEHQSPPPVYDDAPTYEAVMDEKSSQ
ncbi:hypothetical protein PVAG01_09180 [Phlyctema vagabunda]|uniref:DUF7728 domain-containing protein n=1 Tax=Phlyctema vagabunda TaxID=108571 RepID=A0ABR4P6M0_9HELO